MSSLDGLYEKALAASEGRQYKVGDQLVLKVARVPIYSSTSGPPARETTKKVTIHKLLPQPNQYVVREKAKVPIPISGSERTKLQDGLRFYTFNSKSMMLLNPKSRYEVNEVRQSS